MADKKTKNKTTNTASPKKLNAAQKLEALENMVMGIQQQVNIVAEEIDKVGYFVQQLGRRLNASNQVANISHESVNKVLIDESDKQLEAQVNMLLERGVLIESENGDVDNEECFIVGREIDGEGNVVGTRTQFAIMTLVPELRDKFIGQKKGSIVKNEQNENCIEITEVYNVIPLKQEIKFDENATPEDIEPTV